MIQVKAPNEISIMASGGRILAEVLGEVLEYVKPGVSELELDGLAEKLIREKGAKPGFKRVKGYKHTICVSTNDVVVHGIPTRYKFKEGDIIGIDCGVYYKGFNTDAAHTVRVQKSTHSTSSGLSSTLSAQTEGMLSEVEASKVKSQKKKDEIDRFLDAGEKALEEAIKVAKVGNRVGHISKKIQDIIEGARYSVVRSLVGHGVGRSLHEEPEVPGFLARKIEDTPKLRIGMTIAIEAIYNMGKADVAYSNDDGWTIKTKDGNLSGLFERTIAITKSGTMVLTKI